MSIEDIEQKSFAFIDENIDATFDEVPEEFLKFWHISSPLKDYLADNYTEKYEFRIFLYALEKYKREKKEDISSEDTVNIFKVFQLMLAIPAIRKNRLPRETAFKIFDFRLYAELQTLDAGSSHSKEGKKLPETKEN